MKIANRVWMDSAGHELIDRSDGTLQCETCGEFYRVEGMTDTAREVCDADNDDHDWDTNQIACNRCDAPYPD